MPIERRNTGRYGEHHGWVVVNKNGKILFNFNNNLFKPNTPCYTIFSKDSTNYKQCLMYMRERGAKNDNLRSGLIKIRQARQQNHNKKKGTRPMENRTHQRIINWYDVLIGKVIPKQQMMVPRSVKMKK
jgi:hypothetical protein